MVHQILYLSRVWHGTTELQQLTPPLLHILWRNLMICCIILLLATFSKIPSFHVALTTVRASITNPKTQQLAKDACTAFELQVPVQHRKPMEEVLNKAFQQSQQSSLQFVYYKQRHVHPDVFMKAVQQQRKFEQSHRVVAVEGIHPDQHFEFEVTLRQQYPTILAVLPTSKTNLSNLHGLPVGRYNILCKQTNFSTLAGQLHQDLLSAYTQHLNTHAMGLTEEDQIPQVVSRLPRSDGYSGNDTYNQDIPKILFFWGCRRVLCCPWH